MIEDDLLELRIVGRHLRAHEVVDHVLGVDDFRGDLLLEEDEDVRML